MEAERSILASHSRAICEECCKVVTTTLTTTTINTIKGVEVIPAYKCDLCDEIVTQVHRMYRGE